MIFGNCTRKQIFTVGALAAGAILAVVAICVFSQVESKEPPWARPHHHVNKCYRTQPNTTESTLELVHIVFRHGARTPVDTYPNDPYINDSFRPTGWGHVTNVSRNI